MDILRADFKHRRWQMEAPRHFSMRAVRLACTAALFVLAAGGAGAEESVTLAPRPGVSEAMLIDLKDHAPATVLLLPGGGGVISAVQNNFLMRVRGRFSAAGFNVAVLDAPSDRSSGMDATYRASAEHGQDITAAVHLLKQKSSAPIWLVGTSRGSVSAANGAARLGRGEIAGVVLTSSIWSGGMSMVPLGQITVSVLVVHNRDDACGESPYAGVSAGMDALKAAPAKELITVSGGVSRSRPCDALSPHGYYGIEDQVVPPIIVWINAHSR
jgi:pimeloyl-ACP methyl ester carboxylesterase